MTEPPRPALYLLPTFLSAAPWQAILPAAVVERARSLDYFIVENAKTARAHLRLLGHPRTMRELEIRQLPREPDARALESLLEPVLGGRPAGLMSEAGTPAVADPGALLVRRAHEHGIRVVPQVGPSAILLALMGSGLEGQRFAFVGYLPRERAGLAQRIRELERASRSERATQIFIETPYRSASLLATLLQAADADTLLCVASGLTGPAESIATRTIGEWRRRPPDLAGEPAVFLVLAAA